MQSTRASILESALAILRDPDGPNLTLDSTARRAGITKPGLMYHFPTKDSLVLGILQHVAGTWERRFLERLDKPIEESTAAERIRCYVEVTLTAELDLADLAVFFDAHYRDTLAEVWQSTMGPWVELPESTPAAARGKLHAARLAADGFWFASASGALQPSSRDRDAIEAALFWLMATDA